MLLCLTLLLPAGGAGAQPWPELSADYSRYLAAADPLAAGQRGDLAAASRWPDNSPTAMARRQRELTAFRRRLDDIAVGALSPTDALSHAIMRRQVDMALESLAFDEARLPFQDGEGFYTLPETQAAMTVLNGAAGAEAWLARIAAIPDFFEIETANMRRGMRDGFTQPGQTVDKAARVLRDLSREPPEKSALLLPFDTLLTSGAGAGADAAALRARAIALIRVKVRPAQGRLAEFFQNQYRPHARAALGIGSLDKGRYYSFLIRRHTTLALDAAAIQAVGKDEIARIAAEMARLLNESGVTGTPRAYLLALRDDPASRATSAEDYGRRAAEIAKRADYLLPRYFGTLPRLPYGVRQKPIGLDSISSGYLPGSPETGVAGAVIYGGGAGNDLAALPAWLLHEGVPGHHLQIALAQENRDLPDYRRLDDITAYVEGWALYAERLGEEMGIYRTLAERMGRLSMEAWRACRLVMDTGLHVMGWTRDQATACLLENTGMSRDGAYRETDRYIGWPGQALAYKLGEIRIVALRREAEEKMGDRFDLRAFHDLLLSAGALPLDLLEQRVRDHIARP